MARTRVERLSALLINKLPVNRQQAIDRGLYRLDKLVGLHNRYGHETNEAGRRLLRFSTLSVYMDLRDLGYEDRARVILERLPITSLKK